MRCDRLQEDRYGETIREELTRIKGDENAAIVASLIATAPLFAAALAFSAVEREQIASGAALVPTVIGTGAALVFPR